jgi:hypothetical protein
MAYNLRTGLTGSGDIDINVSLDNLDAANITSGTFADARISDLNAAKLTGTLSADRIADESIPKAKIGETLVAWAETEIPTLPKTKILSGANTGQWDTQDIPDLSADKIVSEQLHVDRIPDIPTSKLTGTVASSNLNLTSSDIPELPKSKISSTGEWQTTDLPIIPKFKISTAETWALADIPNLPTTKITSGTLDAARIPNLSALKITSDTLSSSRIPNLDASKITSGTLNASRLPTGIIAYKAVTASGAGLNQNQIGSNYEVIDSNLQMAFVVPASALVEIELTFCAQAVNAESVLARLVYGGTSYEYASYVSLVSPSTNNTLVIYKQDSNSLDVSVTTKWVLQFPSSAIGYGSGNIDAQVKTGGSTQSFTIKWGTGTSSTTQYYPPVIFKATALPSTADLHIHASSGG